MTSKATVSVRTAEVTIRTVLLSPKVFKQIPTINYEKLRQAMKNEDTETFKEGRILGWIAESAHGRGYGPLLLVNFGDGEYGLFPCMTSTAAKYPQVYLT